MIHLFVLLISGLPSKNRRSLSLHYLRSSEESWFENILIESIQSFSIKRQSKKDNMLKYHHFFPPKPFTIAQNTRNFGNNNYNMFGHKGFTFMTSQKWGFPGLTVYRNIFSNNFILRFSLLLPAYWKKKHKNEINDHIVSYKKHKLIWIFVGE